MKSQIRSILFALLLVPACGGDQAAPTSTGSNFFSLPEQTPPAPVADVVAPVAPQKVVVSDEHPMPTTFDDALAQGRMLAGKGDRAGARELFEAAIKLDKKRAEPHIELARLFISSGDRGMAIAAANKGVKLAPDSSQAWNTKGRAELARFDYDSAIEAFTKSVELNRDNVWAWNNLGFAELTLKKYDDAVEHLTEATSRKGATGFMWNNLGTALEQLDRLDEARHAYEQAGTLGSQEALASRKRLEGVKSIAIAAKQDAKPADKTQTYDLREGQTDEDVKMQGSAAEPKDGKDANDVKDDAGGGGGDDPSDTVKPTM